MSNLLRRLRLGCQSRNSRVSPRKSVTRTPGGPGCVRGLLRTSGHRHAGARLRRLHRRGTTRQHADEADVIERRRAREDRPRRRLDRTDGAVVGLWLGYERSYGDRPVGPGAAEPGPGVLAAVAVQVREA